jgi:hypothetical protein
MALEVKATEALPQLFKNQSMQFWSTGPAVDPDNWADWSSGGAAVIAQIIGEIGDYAVRVTNPAAQNTRFYQALVDGTQLTDFSLKDKDVIVILKVKASTANRVRAYISDGVNPLAYSSYHSGGGAYEWLAVNLHVAAASIALQGGIDISAGAAINADVDCAMLFPGVNYPKASDGTPLIVPCAFDDTTQLQEVTGNRGAQVYGVVWPGTIIATINAYIYDVPCWIEVDGSVCMNQNAAALHWMTTRIYEGVTNRGVGGRVSTQVAGYAVYTQAHASWQITAEGDKGQKVITLQVQVDNAVPLWTIDAFCLRAVVHRRSR